MLFLYRINVHVHIASRSGFYTRLDQPRAAARGWFFEQRDGTCRLIGLFAARHSETAPTWFVPSCHCCIVLTHDLRDDTVARSPNVYCYPVECDVPVSV